MKIGTVSLTRRVDPASHSDLQSLWTAIGRNTGNFMFTEAMFSILAGDVEHIGFGFDAGHVNATCDAVVIPAANWLNATNEWDWLTDRVAKLTVPVALIGMGLQADTRDLSKVVVNESAMRFVRTIADRNPAISVRGEFTRAWLNAQGVANVVTTGCPSLYMNVFDQAVIDPAAPFALQGTRYFASRKFNEGSPVERHIFRLCAALDMPMIYQSEAEEMQRMTIGTPIEELSAETQAALAELYGVADGAAVESLIARLGRLFFDVYEWSRFVTGLSGVIGTRLHGTIIALNSGVPALLHGHDSRTQELIDVARLPAIDADTLMSLTSADDVRAALQAADIEAYRDRRLENQKTFQAFLSEFGMRPRPEAMF